MQKSKNYKLPAVIALIIVALIGVYLLVSTVFFERYLLSRKQTMLEQSFYEVRQIIDTATTADILSEFEKLMTNSGISVILLDASGEVIASGTTNVNPLRNQFFEAVLSARTGENTIARTQDYFIQRLTDTEKGTDYLVLCGSASDNTFIMLRVTIESIRESVEMANTFQASIIIILTVICILIVFIVWKLRAANIKLERDIEEANQIDEMRREFLANVSHELKTPIALIQGYAEGLKEGVANDEKSREEYCDVIIDESARMNQMVRQLLNLNRIESGTETLTMERFDICELLSSKITSFAMKAEQSGIKIRLLNEDSCYVCSDASKVEEVIDNYLSNAFDHAAGEKIIEISVRRNEKTTRVNIFNTGDNIPEEDLDKIWIKLYKVDKARTRQFGGYGLGLSIVKAILTELKGAYGAENCDNGVNFWFEIDNG